MAQDKPKQKNERAYTVVEVGEQGQVLRLLVLARIASSQEQAMDAVWDGLPDDRKKIRLGAFLAGSYREVDYDQETIVKPLKKAGRRFEVDGSEPKLTH